MQERADQLEKDLALREAELAAMNNMHADPDHMHAASVTGISGSEEAAAVTAATAAAGRGTLSHSPSENSLKEFAAQFNAAVKALQQWMHGKGLLDQPMVRPHGRLPYSPAHQVSNRRSAPQSSFLRLVGSCRLNRIGVVGQARATVAAVHCILATPEPHRTARARTQRWFWSASGFDRQSHGTTGGAAPALAAGTRPPPLATTVQLLKVRSVQLAVNGVPQVDASRREARWRSHGALVLISCAVQLTVEDLVEADVRQLAELARRPYALCLQSFSMYTDVDVAALVGSSMDQSLRQYHGGASMWHDLALRCALADVTLRCSGAVHCI